MLKFGLILLLLPMFVSCSKKSGSKNENAQGDTVTVYNEEDFFKIKYGKKKYKHIIIKDTVCAYGEKMAKEDLKKGTLTYTFIDGFGSHNYSNKEMEVLLLKKSIKMNVSLGSCIVPPKGFARHCYTDFMNNEIEKKFGANFIDSLRYIADVEFIKNNPKFVFDIFECDTTSRYAKAKSYKEYLKIPQKDFAKRLVSYGLNKDQLKKQQVNTQITFIIYKDGTVGEINAESNFINATSKDFAVYFENEAIAFVKDSKWTPALYKGIKVNSKLYLNLYNGLD